jgi:hypothetical protein
MTRAFSTRRGFAAILLAFASVFGTDSKQYTGAVRQGRHVGKHNGRTRGAFGGRSKFARAASKKGMHV